ncbi:hypothetical protein LIER_29518 [Lithospermum erythrorhizon]|uniref:Lysine ketoglutarate reductase trans-splicing related 1 n=1 Tax=Lithospermum erythrorhizon TaxID=34254 RepID=A0AAV3RJW1_LITER
MRALKSGSWPFKRKHISLDGGTCRPNLKQLPFLGAVCTIMLFIVYRTTNYQYEQTEMESRLFPFYSSQEYDETSSSLLPRGIINTGADYKLKPLWSSSSSKSKAEIPGEQNLLAIPVGIKQKHNVDTIVRKFLSEKFTVILFHYDGNVDGWWDFEWCKDAVHVVGLNQTKWWFAKRFLHPSVVNPYNYIFLWDEDLGVEYFDPGRYLDIVRSEGLEISQPALDPNSTGIHHRITIRQRTKRFHRRVYETRGSYKCSEYSDGPPCSGFVEGMAPVFSKSAWRCAWHLIQNDLVHGWGMDMKLGYCAQGERSKKVGVVDSEYLVHQSIQTLGGQSDQDSNSKESVKKHVIDVRSEIRRQSTNELLIFEDRWDKAAKEDRNWVDPYRNSPKQKRKKIHRKIKRAL